MKVVHSSLSVSYTHLEQLHRLTGIGSYEIQKHIYRYHSRSEKIKQYQLERSEKDKDKCPRCV